MIILLIMSYVASDLHVIVGHGYFSYCVVAGVITHTCKARYF